MATATQTATVIQDKVFAGLEASQKALVDCVRTWAETVETVFAKLPELATSEPMKPSQVFESTFGFTEKVLASQREFASKVFEAALPATRAPAAAAAAARANAPKG